MSILPNTDKLRETTKLMSRNNAVLPLKKRNSHRHKPQKSIAMKRLTKRLSELKLKLLIASIEAGEREFEAGLCKPMTASEIMREAMS
jgi:hypothetical protein